MLDPADLFSLAPHVEPPESEQQAADRPPLLVTLGSYGDAGQTQALIDEHLFERLANHKVGTFDVDQLFDYTGHRPPIVFDRDHFRDYQAPEIALHALSDSQGNSFLLLSGPEPALQWERLAASVERVIERYRVERVIVLQSIPAPAPHTRPVHVTGFASDPSLLGDREGIPGMFQMGASFVSLLTLRLGEHGKDVLGLVAHVPHYLSETTYPDAALALLGQASTAAGLVLPTDGRLAQSAQVTRRQIDSQIAQSSEAQEVVARLEEQYEQWADQRALTPRPEVPSADEIGAEVEEFLKGLDNPDEQ
ncbi:MAG: PAC2 family protein [Acidobacteriota bacterium]|nr:PAC2 family protein [Acidobacteriota bacterium]NLH69992.1 PAC2 family protein [Brooklawnia sp.]